MQNQKIRPKTKQKLEWPPRGAKGTKTLTANYTNYAKGKRAFSPRMTRMDTEQFLFTEGKEGSRRKAESRKQKAERGSDVPGVFAHGTHGL
jgi:hypothetical protein